MSKLFHTHEPPPDMRAAFLSVAALMVLLLPLLLMTSSAQKLTGLALGVPGPTEELPPELPGQVERLVVQRVPQGYAVSAAVRNTDVLASAGDVEDREFFADDLAALQEVLGSLKQLDPKRERVTLVPAADTPTHEVVAWMDAVRAGPSGELYPRVVLDSGRAVLDSGRAGQ